MISTESLIKNLFVKLFQMQIQMFCVWNWFKIVFVQIVVAALGVYL